MSLASVQVWIARFAPDLIVVETQASSATVAEAAAAHGVEPARIAKTLTLRAQDRAFLLVLAGTARLDNKKAKAVFGGKVSMLDAGEAERLTGHPVGGVCPFGLGEPLPVYCDVSLRAFATVWPAAGSPNSALEIAPQRLASLTQAVWIDVAADFGS